MTANVFLGAATLRAGNGGIARVARLMDRVLAEEVTAGRLKAQAASYLDDNLPDVRLPVSTARGSKLRYVWQVHKAALSCDHFLYDNLGMAQAHCRLPLLRRPSLSWICGLEVWENTFPSRITNARRTDVLVSVSDYVRQRADRIHGGFKRAQVCWLGTDTDDAPATPESSDRRPTVTILGRMDEVGHKGHDELIDGWPKVVGAVPDARLLIVGQGAGQDELRRKAAASPAAEHIVFRGFVPEEDMPKVWDETMVFAMPSRRDGFGLVYIEAMRQGVPVIASVHDGAQEINRDGVTGYNVDLDKPDELPERIIYLLKNPDRAATLGRNAQNHWREHFRYSAFKGRFLPILNAFLTSAKSA
jgi:phosphatidylinositol alpha-1,6-mannosyltransferase